MNINYIPQSTFNTVLNHTQNVLDFRTGFSNKSYIHCEHCRNQWLINHNKKEQVVDPLCKTNPDKQLSHQEIATKLKTKCKKSNSKFNFFLNKIFL